jgi:hypothetical protein
MKHLTTYIKESVFDPIKTYGDILSPEELNYKFKVLIYSKIVKDIIADSAKHYQKNPEETAELLKKDIIIDTLLYNNRFSNRDRVNIVSGDQEYGNIYQTKTAVNPKGYCVVFDPYSLVYHNWCFLVTRAASKVGKTLKPVEWVEPKNFEEKNHQYDQFKGIPRTFYDNIEDAWKYIESKYGKF